MLSTILAFLASPVLFLKEKEVEVPPSVVAPDPFSKEDVIAWLETKDPSEYYDYGDPGCCLFGQYTAARGGAWPGGNYYIGNHSMYAGRLEGWHYRVAAAGTRT